MTGVDQHDTLTEGTTMHVFAHMTGERVTAESAAHGDAEERGWVDPQWSRKVFHDSRNDVRPVVSEDLTSEDLADRVREALEDLGAFEDNGDGTFYSADAEQDFITGDYFTYALHFTLKSHGPQGWAEREWHPSEAGITV